MPVTSDVTEDAHHKTPSHAGSRYPCRCACSCRDSKPSLPALLLLPQFCFFVCGVNCSVLSGSRFRGAGEVNQEDTSVASIVSDVPAMMKGTSLKLRLWREHPLLLTLATNETATLPFQGPLGTAGWRTLTSYQRSNEGNDGFPIHV